MLGMMKKGKRFIVIPPVFAYGSKAVGNKVPANSTLAFEVDIMRVDWHNFLFSYIKHHNHEI